VTSIPTGSSIPTRFKKGKGVKGKKGKTAKTSEQATCAVTGSEVWPPFPASDLKMILTTDVNTSTCQYDISLAYQPRGDGLYPIVDSPTAENFFGMDPIEYDELCTAEGRLEDGTVLTPEEHSGLNEHYNHFVANMGFSERAMAATGIKNAGMDIVPCGQIVTPFPHYGIHFWSATYEERAERACYTGGGIFCRDYSEQCTEGGRKFQTNGEGIPTCDDGSFKNLPKGASFVLDGMPFPTPNGASTNVGLHGLDFADTTGDPRNPLILGLNYDSNWAGIMILSWAGFAKGEADSNYFEKLMPEYGCPDPGNNFPTKTTTVYDPETNYTTTSISGPLLDCSGESFKEVSDFTKKSKHGKKGKNGGRRKVTIFS